ncbi:hypothetical protein Tco_0176554, partial [Tanacetum coccineum]
MLQCMKIIRWGGWQDVAEGIGNTTRHEYGLSSSNGWTKIAYHSEFGRYAKDLRYMEGKERLKVARDRQKSYADSRRKPIEFEVGDQVLLKVSPWKGVVRFRKKDKLVL